MKLNSKSILFRIWKYLIIFSLLILIFLWLFQVTFLSRYYELCKRRAIKHVASQIVDNYDGTDSFLNSLDDISNKEGICIEVATTDTDWYYSSNMNHSCLPDKKNPDVLSQKKKFAVSDDKTMSIKVATQNDIDVLIYGLKLDDKYFIFLNTVLDPIDSTIKILENQLIIVTIIVILLSAIIAYFISNRLSRPITSLNKSAKTFAKGDYNVVFPNSDISEINELSNSLNYAKKELAKTDELRKDLMANVSHDLKTPLTMIKAYSEMVRDITYKDDVKREENLNTIIEEVDRLNLLVSDILDQSSIQSNIDILKKEDFDLISLINSIIKRFQIFSKTESFEFKFIYDTEKIIINADKQKIEQVIYNLIGNAINYSNKEKVITIKVLDDKDKIRVEIIDKGEGIDKEELKYIWDRYYKVNKKYKRKIVGTGLGLSIVKSILELHNYKYGVNSEKKKGTTFYFEINKEKND